MRDCADEIPLKGKWAGQNQIKVLIKGLRSKCVRV